MPVAPLSLARSLALPLLLHLLLLLPLLQQQFHREGLPRLSGLPFEKVLWKAPGGGRDDHTVVQACTPGLERTSWVLRSNRITLFSPRAPAEGAEVVQKARQPSSPASSLLNSLLFCSAPRFIQSDPIRHF